MNKKTMLAIAAMLALAGAANAAAIGTADASSAKMVAAAISAVKSGTTEKEGWTAIQGEIDRRSERLKPGEALAYYVADPALNPADKISFATRGYLFKTYADFTAKLKKLKGPAFPKPTSLPKGYKLAKAIVYLSTPEPASQVYNRLEEELKEEAASGKKTVYFKSIATDKATGGSLIYEKNVGKKKLTMMISAAFLPQNPAEDPGGTPVPAIAEKGAEKVKIKGTEAIYTFDAKASYPASLVWTDKKNKVQYRIYRQGSENKKELIAIAGSMMV